MDLKSMLLNNFIGNAQFNTQTATSKDFTSSKSSSNKFDSYLNKASNSSTQKKDSSVNSSKKDDLKSNSKNLQKSDNSTQKNDANKTSNSKSTNSTNKTGNDNNSKTEKSEDTNKEIVEAIAQKTGLSVEEINATLQNLNMQAADLMDSNNLVAFMQELMGVENAIDLLSIDGMKDIMSGIQEVFAESDKFTDFANSLKNAQENAGLNAETISSDVVSDVNSQVISDENMTDSDTSNVQTTEVIENVATSNTAQAGDKTDDNSILSEESLRSRYAIDDNAMVNNQSTEEAVKQVTLTENNSNFSQQFSNNQSNENLNVSNVVMDNITKSFNEVVIKNEATSNVNSAEVVKQIIDKIKVGINKDVTELKVNLKPEHLGDVTVKIATQNGIVTAQITAESQRVKEIIESGFNELKQALIDAGVEVSELEVNVGSDESENANGFAQNFSNDKSDKRIGQIIDGIFAEETENTTNYVKEEDVVNSSVSYTV